MLRHTLLGILMSFCTSNECENKTLLLYIVRISEELPHACIRHLFVSLVKVCYRSRRIETGIIIQSSIQIFELISFARRKVHFVDVFVPLYPVGFVNLIPR